MNKDKLIKLLDDSGVFPLNSSYTPISKAEERRFTEHRRKMLDELAAQIDSLYTEPMNESKLIRYIDRMLDAFIHFRIADTSSALLEEDNTEQIRELGRKFRTYRQDLIDLMQKPVADKTEPVRDKEFQAKLDSLPYTKHLDDGQYNDGVVTGFEMCWEWMKQRQVADKPNSFSDNFKAGKRAGYIEAMKERSVSDKWINYNIALKEYMVLRKKGMVKRRPNTAIKILMKFAAFGTINLPTPPQNKEE